MSPNILWKKNLSVFFYILLAILITNCSDKKSKTKTPEIESKKSSKLKVIFDSDANNELDDQHALAYLLLNGDTFKVDAVTVNATYNGGDIQGHYEEALRILKLCNLANEVPLLKGANGNFNSIIEDWDPNSYDGKEGVDYLIKATKREPIVIIAVGKLTNIALALKKDPTFAQRTKIVWLGSNYPEPGEYNQDNDTIAMNYVLNSSIPFEMVTVRYGKPSGTDAVKVTKKEINEKMPGIGPKAIETVIGRHGGEFDNFGDYSVSLFEYIDYHGDPPSRPLFDMVAVAILKDETWGEIRSIPAPILINNKWEERPDNPRKITIWENFKKEELLEDFYKTLLNPIPVSN